MLALTLPLGLSRDDSATPVVSSSSVRVLGVYCTLSCLREVRWFFCLLINSMPLPVPQDKAFLQDSGVAILHALTSTSQIVRVQASWALGNLTDALFSSSFTAEDGSCLLSIPLLLNAVKNALMDKDMVC